MWKRFSSNTYYQWVVLKTRNRLKEFTSRPGLGSGLGDGNTVLSGVFEQSGSTVESLVEFGQSPRSNDLDVGGETVKGELESDLVVTLAGTTMRDIVATFLDGGLNHASGNNGTSEGSTKEVDVLVDGITLNGSWI